MYKKILILFTILLLASCSNSNNKQTNDYESIEVKDYAPDIGGYSESYLIDATTESSPDNFKSNNLLYLPNDETIKVNYGNFGESGNDHNLIMKVFYDYKMIDFKLADTDTYHSEYIFSLENGKEIDIPILLDDDEIIFDENMHKLLVTFTTGYNQHASDFDSVTDEYGINAVFDVVHNLDYKNKTMSYSYDYLLPENNFEQNYVELSFNTDYENVTQKSEFGGVLNPAPFLKVKKSSELI